MSKQTPKKHSGQVQFYRQIDVILPEYEILSKSKTPSWSEIPSITVTRS